MAKRKSKKAKLRGLFIRRDGDRYIVEITQPAGKFDIEVRTPQQIDTLLKILIELGFSVREFLDAIALSNKFGKSCLR